MENIPSEEGGRAEEEHGSSEEKDLVCAECGGSGLVPVLSRVYPGEPHEADLGETTKCPYCS